MSDTMAALDAILRAVIDLSWELRHDEDGMEQLSMKLEGMLEELAEVSDE